MIPCVCIDDRNKPREIPAEKWVKQDQTYRILGIYVHPAQDYIRGVKLAELLLDDSCKPYETFRMSRFAIKEEDIPALIQLAQDCADIQKLKDAEVEEVVRREFEVIEQ